MKKAAKKAPKVNYKRNTYEFIVKHGDWSARILTHSAHTLFDFAGAIIRSVEFEMDHAFGFYEPDYFKPRRRKSSMESADFVQYSLLADMHPSECPESDLGVESVFIEDVFEVGEPFIFLFDYGDDWRFEVMCLSINYATILNKKPYLASTIGTPPKQYPDDDDEQSFD